MRKRTLIVYDPSLDNNLDDGDIGKIARIFKMKLDYDVKIITKPKSNENFLADGIDIVDMSDDEKVDYALRDGNILMTWGYFYEWINVLQRYRVLNPEGKIYLKLQMNPYWFNNLGSNPLYLDFVKSIDIISIECKRFKENIERIWNLDLEYIPNGYYGINDDRIIEFEEKENIIVSVTELGDPIKGIDTLLEAFSLCADTLKNWQLKLIGPINESFINLINRFYFNNPSLIEKVIYKDISDDSLDIEDEYRKAKIFCLPSQNETFPSEFSNAAIKGCYIVSTKIDAAYDITDEGRIGAIFTPNDYNELKNIFIECNNNSEELEQACYDTQIFCRDNFDMVKICYKIHELIRSDKQDVYFIGENNNLWVDYAINTDRINKKYFKNFSEFYNSESYKKICINADIKPIDSNSILIYKKDENSNDNQKNILRYFKRIYEYDEIYHIVTTTINGVRHLYGEEYYRNYDYYFLSYRLNLLRNDTGTRILITGLSYALYGLDEKLFKYKTCNLALPSQDIYYAYKISKKVISNNNNINYCLIGISYYSLHFDLSKCSDNFRVDNVYYPIFKNAHNYKVDKNLFINKKIIFNSYLSGDLVKIIKTETLDTDFKDKLYGELAESYFNKNVTRESAGVIDYKLNELSEKEREDIAIETVKSKNNLLKHKDTVEENAIILKKFIDFLISKDVMPIVCIFPTPSYYNKYLHKEFKTILYECLDELKSLNNFTVVDLNNYEEFVLDDFIDMHHLNYKGAVKATNIINNLIR